MSTFRMKILPAFFLCIALFLAVGCKKQPKPSHGEFKPDEIFELQNGGSARLAGGGLKLTFTAVVEDSRCPKGLDCFQEGRIRITLAAISNEQVRVMEFSRQASQTGPVTRPFENFSIQWLEVSPYPEGDVKIRVEEYKLRLRVKKQEDGGSDS